MLFPKSSHILIISDDPTTPEGYESTGSLFSSTSLKERDLHNEPTQNWDDNGLLIYFTLSDQIKSKQ